MKKLLFTVALAFLFASGVEAAEKEKPKFPVPEQAPLAEMPSGEYKVDAIHSSLVWRVKHFGLTNYTGRFGVIKGTLDFDSKNPLNSKVDITVDPKSVRTDYDLTKFLAPEKYHKRDWDKELGGDKWLDTDKNPDIRFVSTKVEKTGERTGVLHGDLTFRGVTKPVKLDAVFGGSILEKPFDGRPLLGFSAKGMIKRSEFGSTFLAPLIADEVEVIVEVEFLHGDPKPEKK